MKKCNSRKNVINTIYTIIPFNCFTINLNCRKYQLTRLIDVLHCYVYYVSIDIYT